MANTNQRSKARRVHKGPEAIGDHAWEDLVLYYKKLPNEQREMELKKWGRAYRRQLTRALEVKRG